ncbi:OVARIAN TUMOR DOMAIN-containing deubiquitinating enzyme 7 isoform X2 [Rhododendron vialii]|uniref:OVARIAN TUMOR DOMAIN-containing deubiquitinating enzyme 7 isoform X2 n=2 Tax=Rhododendron vialii TaxID=182163 RepID=UPI00265E8CF6|nr:OVARIAN TUMOR DOMAIN-containing deubiquitinating enzyme 7 isoform X2 [Rhododendron vialii]
MVKAKHQKHKPNKQSHIKKHGKQGDISEFHAQLDALGLKIFQVTADGNCFFRAFADQVEGNEEEHQRYRSMVNNREMFEPFIEDDVSFDEYCQSMEKDGTWAGNMELQAASLVTRTNICIHRNKSPRWYIRNFDSHEAQMVHLSYHDGEHYNSVRLKEDTSNGPARPIIIKADADLSAISCKAKAAVTKSKGGAGKNVIHADSIKLVMAGSGCEDAKKVEQILQEFGGDVDAANEFLIAEQATADYLAESDKLSCPADSSHGIFENGNYEQQTEELKDNSCMSEQSCDKETTHDSESSHKDEKKVARNKVCPCGSKKKYKACCGSVSGRSSKFTIIQTVDYSKSRKDRMQGKKSGSKDVANSCGGEGAPDVGALCI